MSPSLTRRDLMKAATVAGTLAAVPSVHAAGGDVLRVGLVGCGGYSIREMASKAAQSGFAWFAICDHSRTAVYARGLTLERLEQQWAEVDALNASGEVGIPILKGVESDILPDGSLDRWVGLPVESTTSLSFGGPNLDIAYVTSMARTVKGVAPKEREAGGLFAVHGLGVRGLPEPRFRG